MKNKIRLEDFPNVNYYYGNGNYYAYNSDTGECAIFNNKKELLFHSHFSPGGELSQYAHIQSCFPNGLNWEKGDVLAIAWCSATNHEVIKFGLYNIKDKSYVLPMNNMDNYDITYSYTRDETAVFFKSNDSLFIINNDGNLVGKVSKCEYFKTDFFNFESKTLVVGRERKKKCGLEYKYGVYSCKEKRMILPVEFDKIQLNCILGILVTKNNQMGIYSYEGAVLTELDNHHIEPICEPYAAKGDLYKTLVKISSQEKNKHRDMGVFTLDHQCIIPIECRAIYYHSDEFLIVQNHNLSWTVYSVSKRKNLIPPCIGVKIGKFDTDETITIRATKYLQLQGHGGYIKTIEDNQSSEYLSCVTVTPVTYEKFVKPDYKYHVCYDIYSMEGELIKEDVMDTLSEQIFCSPYIDSCVSFSSHESR